MTSKVYKYIFRLLGQETGMLISKYPDDEGLLNKLYSDFLLDTGDKSIAIKNYLTLLIGYAENNEYYEKCATLLKIKKMIP